MRLIRPIKFLISLLFLLAQFALCLQVFAFEVVGLETTPPLSQIAILRDPQGTMDLDEVRQAAKANRFNVLSSELGATDFGFTNDTLWLKLSLSRNPASDKNRILEIPYLGLDSVSLYYPDGAVAHVGGDVPANQKTIFQRFHAFPLTLGTAPQDFYLRVQSQYALSVPLVLWQIHAYTEAKFIDNLIQSLYYGGLLALAAYNLLLFFSLRERRYALYVAFVMLIGLGMFAGNGYGFLLLWPNFPEWNTVAQSVFFSLAAAMSVLFTQAFLKTKQTLTRFHGWLNACAIFYGALAALLALSVVVVLPRGRLFELLMLTTLPMALFLFLVIYQAMRRGDTAAKFLLFAFGCLWVGGAIAALRALGVVPTNSFTAYALQIGSAFEVLLISFALAHQIHVERALRHRAETLHEQYIRFSSLISHEFRTPLNAIESQAALIERESERGQDGDRNHIKQRTDVIMSAVQQLSFLFTRWVQADRLKNAMNQVNTTAVDLYMWLGQVIDRSRDFYASHAIELEVDAETKMIRADAGLLQIALMNLIDNACKYAPEGSVIQVGTMVHDGLTGLYVTDHGIGIPLEQHARIFDEYMRLNPEDKAPGVGLGLAFVRKIMELHAGRVEVRSQLGSGSTFILWFPNAP